MVDLWVYFLLFANFAIQLSTFIRPLVIFLSTFGLFTYSAKLDLAVFEIILIMYTVTDLLTSLSILYLHHRIGLRQISPKKKVKLFRDTSEVPGQLMSRALLDQAQSLKTDIQEDEEGSLEVLYTSKKAETELGFTDFQSELYNTFSNWKMTESM